MVVLTKPVVIISQYVCIYQITMLYTLNLSNVICQLYLNKPGRNKKEYILLLVFWIYWKVNLTFFFFSQTQW